MRSLSPSLVLLATLSLAIGAACGPIGPLPGGALDGPVHAGPAPDWSFVDEVLQIQLESRPEDPYSVNTWVGQVDGRLYVPSSLIRGPDDPSERGG